MNCTSSGQIQALCVRPGRRGWFHFFLTAPLLAAFSALQRNLLVGSVPATIGNLTALTALKLGLNNISGTIPESVYGLTLLSLLDFSQNPISGTISNSIGQLTALTTVWLGGIQHAPFSNLTGTIPSSVGRLTNVAYLCACRYLVAPFLTRAPPPSSDFSFNQLSGSLPASIGSLTSLVSQLCATDKAALAKRLQWGGLQLELPCADAVGAQERQQQQPYRLYPRRVREPHRAAGCVRAACGSSRVSSPCPEPLAVSNRTTASTLGRYLGINNLVGPLPPSIGKMRSLRWLCARPYPRSFRLLTQ